MSGGVATHRLGRVWHSLTFRILGLNLAGFLLTFLVFFYLLDRFQYKYLLQRTDQELEQQLLVITSSIGELHAEVDAPRLQNELTRHSQATGISAIFLRAFSSDGMQIASSDLSFWRGVERHPLPLAELENRPLVWESTLFGRESARMIHYRFPEGTILQIGRSLDEVHQLMNYSRRLIGFGILLVLVMGGSFSWFFTYRGLRGIRQVSEAAQVIREHGQLDLRVLEATGTAETDNLAATFNQMLAQIQKLMVNLRYVVDNVAHDLKTPVTRMRGMAEAELRKRQSEELEVSGMVVEECDQLLNLINTLLEISSAEGGIYRWQTCDLDLAELVREGCELFAPVLEEKALALECQLPQHMFCRADAHMLQRVVANLLDNAIKYSDEGGRIEVALCEQDGWVELVIRDHGIGIAPADLARIFERFFRADRSRSRQGNGLGLAFCRAAIEGMGGNIRCTSQLEQGSTFSVRLQPALGHFSSDQ